MLSTLSNLLGTSSNSSPQSSQSQESSETNFPLPDEQELLAETDNRLPADGLDGLSEPLSPNDDRLANSPGLGDLEALEEPKDSKTRLQKFTQGGKKTAKGTARGAAKLTSAAARGTLGAALYVASAGTKLTGSEKLTTKSAADPNPANREKQEVAKLGVKLDAEALNGFTEQLGTIKVPAGSLSDVKFNFEDGALRVGGKFEASSDFASKIGFGTIQAEAGVKEFNISKNPETGQFEVHVELGDLDLGGSSLGVQLLGSEATDYLSLTGGVEGLAGNALWAINNASSDNSVLKPILGEKAKWVDAGVKFLGETTAKALFSGAVNSDDNSSSPVKRSTNTPFGFTLHIDALKEQLPKGAQFKTDGVRLGIEIQDTPPFASIEEVSLEVKDGFVGFEGKAYAKIDTDFQRNETFSQKGAKAINRVRKGVNNRVDPTYVQQAKTDKTGLVDKKGVALSKPVKVDLDLNAATIDSLLIGAEINLGLLGTANNLQLLVKDGQLKLSGNLSKGPKNALIDKRIEVAIDLQKIPETGGLRIVVTDSNLAGAPSVIANRIEGIKAKAQDKIPKMVQTMADGAADKADEFFEKQAQGKVSKADKRAAMQAADNLKNLPDQADQFGRMDLSGISNSSGDTKRPSLDLDLSKLISDNAILLAPKQTNSPETSRILVGAEIEKLDIGEQVLTEQVNGQSVEVTKPTISLSLSAVLGTQTVDQQNVDMQSLTTGLNSNLESANKGSKSSSDFKIEQLRTISVSEQGGLTFIGIDTSGKTISGDIKPAVTRKGQAEFTLTLNEKDSGSTRPSKSGNPKRKQVTIALPEANLLKPQEGDKLLKLQAVPDNKQTGTEASLLFTFGPDNS